MLLNIVLQMITKAFLMLKFADLIIHVLPIILL